MLAIVNKDATMLTILAVATIALWALATARHTSVPHAPTVRPGQHP